MNEPEYIYCSHLPNENLNCATALFLGNDKYLMLCEDCDKRIQFEYITSYIQMLLKDAVKYITWGIPKTLDYKVTVGGK